MRLKANSTKVCGLLALLFVSVTSQAQIAKNMAGPSPWGSADEIGTLNMMTDASRLDVLERVASGKVYDLGVDLFVGMPDCCSDLFGDPSYQMWMTHVPARAGHELISHSSDVISMSTHTGTHIDTLSHFGLYGKIWNEVSADDALGVRGWAKSGADKYPPIVGRGVLVDVAKAKNLDHLPDFIPSRWQTCEKRSTNRAQRSRPAISC